jgi:(4-(4-[2-(gamma-L-glutamylamino)ethyl]phenoxymethyl)furan-2-yl)methanamine synthase
MAHMAVVIGWDIGGAHLKAARAEDGRIVDAAQLASPFRLGLDVLERAFEHARTRMGAADRHAVTMTGELADTFTSRSEGVSELVRIAVDALSPDPVQIYGGRSGFIPAQLASRHVADIASANWHAVAALVARTLGSALVADMGSTTTDLIPVAAGTIAAVGYTDAERLVSGELVYTGLVRSFVMAVASRAPVAGSWTTLVNENFASMADVHRLLGSLPPEVDQMATADGRGKTREASCARLARMLGRDAADLTDRECTALAHWFAEAQIRAVADAAMLVLSRGRVPPEAPMVACGIGATVIAEVARRLGRACVGLEDVIQATPSARRHAAQCAPAAALALIASDGREP